MIEQCCHVLVMNSLGTLRSSEKWDNGMLNSGKTNHVAYKKKKLYHCCCIGIWCKRSRAAYFLLWLAMQMSKGIPLRITSRLICESLAQGSKVKKIRLCHCLALAGRPAQWSCWHCSFEEVFEFKCFYHEPRENILNLFCYPLVTGHINFAF